MMHVRIFNIKRTKTNKYLNESVHHSYGIQKWLVLKGYCLFKGTRWKVDAMKYEELLKSFCLHDNPEFRFSSVISIRTLETYVQNRFVKFCNYVIKLHTHDPLKL